MRRIESAGLSLNAVSLAYERSEPVIRDLSLSVEPGEMIALLGASGCGKTTVLKLIAGLLTPKAGSILIDGEAVNDVRAELRRTAMVFQKPLLFPYLTVGENVGFALKLRGASANTIRERVGEALGLVRLEGYETRRPEQLSGGQEQRVSLARALVSEPRILLLDEPFAALDESLRGEIRLLVRGIQRRLQLTTIFVTHDQNEAAAMANRVAFLREGRVSQVGPLREFYERPADVETAKFFGWQILRGTVASGVLTSGLGKMACGGMGGEAWAAVRSDAVRFATEGGAEALVESSIDLGTRVSTTVRLTSGELLEVHHGPPEIVPGSTLHVMVDERTVCVFAIGRS